MIYQFLLQKRVSNEASWTGQRNFHQSNRFLVNARVLNIWWLMKYFGFIILMRSVFTLICNWWAWYWVVHHNSWANPYGPRQYSQWWPPGHHISGRSFTTGSDFHRTWQVSLTSSAPYGAWCRTSIYRVHNQILKITNVFAFFSLNKTHTTSKIPGKTKSVSQLDFGLQKWWTFKERAVLAGRVFKVWKSLQNKVVLHVQRI